MEDLSWFFNRYPNDKLSYIDFYSRLISDLDPKILIEIGISNENSLRMWKEIFPGSRVVGMSPDSKFPAENPDLEIVVGDQSNIWLLDKILSNIGIPDLIIDDGTHHRSKQLAAFQYIFPRLNKGGVYVIEDLETCFVETYDDHPSSVIDSIISLILPSNFNGNTKGRKLSDYFNYSYQHISFERNICLIKK